MNRLSLVATLLVLAGLGSSAECRGGQPEPKKIPPAVAELLKLTPDEFLKRFDKNNDGALTKDELPPFLGKAFDAVDKGGAGKLDRKGAEALLTLVRNFFAQQGTGPTEAQIEKVIAKLLELDANNDGKISKQEARGKLTDNFAALDANKDGFLDRAELRRVALALLQAQNPAMNPLDFDAHDRNADGRLTPDEVRGTMLEKLFREIDANNDGRISREEFEAFMEKREKESK
jgi:Ca2+-binding EF-hand superfamily protein